MNSSGVIEVLIFYLLLLVSSHAVQADNELVIDVSADALALTSVLGDIPLYSPPILQLRIIGSQSPERPASLGDAVRRVELSVVSSLHETLRTVVLRDIDVPLVDEQR